MMISFEVASSRKISSYRWVLSATLNW